VAIPISSIPFVLQEVQTRRTNVDLAARELMLKAGPRDLIIVDPFYCGISFKRYYVGKTPWTTVPPLGNDPSGESEAIKKAMMEDSPMAELFSSAGETLRSGGRIWVMGRDLLIEPDKIPPAPPAPPNGPLGWNHGPYSYYWSRRLGAFLLAHANHVSRISVDPGRPVNPFETVSLLVFSVHPWRQAD
jgi:hypothetical protein